MCVGSWVVVLQVRFGTFVYVCLLQYQGHILFFQVVCDSNIADDEPLTYNKRIQFIIDNSSRFLLLCFFVCCFAILTSSQLYIILIRPERNVRQSMMPVRYSAMNKTTGTGPSSMMAAIMVTAATCNQNEKIEKQTSIFTPEDAVKLKVPNMGEYNEQLNKCSVLCAMCKCSKPKNIYIPHYTCIRCLATDRTCQGKMPKCANRHTLVGITIDIYILCVCNYVQSTRKVPFTHQLITFSQSKFQLCTFGSNWHQLCDNQFIGQIIKNV